MKNQMIGQSRFNMFAFTDALLVGTAVGFLSLIAATVTAYFALKGKKVEAGEWITDELRTDAQSARERAIRAEKSFQEYKIDADKKFEAYKQVTQNEISQLKDGINDLRSKETELISYIRILQNEMHTFRELYLAAVGSTPNINFYQVDPNKLSNDSNRLSEDIDQIEQDLMGFDKNGNEILDD